MKNQLPILPDQEILNALQAFKEEWLQLLQKRSNMNKQNIQNAKKYLLQKLLVLKELITIYPHAHFSMEFYSDLNELLQSISPLRLEEQSWLEQSGLLEIIDQFCEISTDNIYKHPLLMAKKSQEILSMHFLPSPQKNKTLKQVLANLDIIKNHLQKTSQLAQMASERSLHFDENSLPNLLKQNAKSAKKNSDMMQNLLEDSSIMMLLAASASLLADRAAQVSVLFQKMLTSAKKFANNETPTED